MTNNPPKVLFITHDCSRTGAPRMTLKLVRWLTERGLVEPVVLAGGAGPLQSEFRSVAPTVTDPLHSSGSLGRAAGRLPAFRRASVWSAKRAIQKYGPYDAVYSSTLTNGRLLRHFVPEDTPVLSRASELSHWVTTAVKPEDLAVTISRSKQIIAVSNAVRSMLTEELAYPAENVHVIPGFVEAVPAPARIQKLRTQKRDELGIGHGEMVVGCVGTLDWRKGPDLFLQIARLVSAKNQSVRFQWIGAGDSTTLARLRHDADRMGLSNFHLLGDRPDAAAAMASLDLLCLTSREDPYPVVMLEAAACFVPTVAFDGSGGAPEFTTRGGGQSVPYLDLDAMAAAVAALLDDSDRRQSLGATAREVVIDGHTLDSVAPRIAELLERVRRSTGRPSAG